MNSSLFSSRPRLIPFLHGFQRLRDRLRDTPTSELLLRVEEATTSAELSKAVNRVQKRLWETKTLGGMALGDALSSVLRMHVVHASSASLRTAAAAWLRMLLQTGKVSSPQEVFVTFVVAATGVVKGGDEKEQGTYLKLLFECFWPFRSPCPAYTWQQFPANEVFYPLAPLLQTVSVDTQEMLLAIFSELPTLDDAEIAEHLLPLALAWSSSNDAEHRRQVSAVLARMQSSSAQDALHHLQSDEDQSVREGAKYAANLCTKWSS